MSKTVPFPASLKRTIRNIASERNYPLVQEIARRGSDEELVLESKEEAQAIVDVARVEMLDASLKYPFWNDDSPRHEPKHEEAFQDVQMGFFEKVVMYVGQEFDVVTRV
jgi:hypothetical protein